ncbi:145_t:CDS:2 [Paraglomus occultum]|uniref:145_t:CDS:1 n=1 Tax=Paraglomus occultum TaxID=144539 RepID=A0A9N9GAI1_9GLOM|nr:145_t:CDS:2 [Paraglomus occultum]
MSCDDAAPTVSLLPSCIKMTHNQFSLVTSIFNLGGLFGSLFLSRYADSKGRWWTLLANTVILGCGALIMGFASTIAGLVIGRIVVGIGSGVATVVVPTYLAEIAPTEYRGTFGVMNQLGVVLGILFSQVLGLYFSTIPGWRIILLAGSATAVVQAILLNFIVESPKYLASSPGRYSDAKKALQRLRGTVDVDDELRAWTLSTNEEVLEGLIEDTGVEMTEETEEGTSGNVFYAKDTNEVDVWKFIKSAHYRPALIVILIAQITQQLSGINAVIYYSATILSKILPTSNNMITVFISIVNTIMTVISAGLIDKAGRRKLLLLSISSMSITSALLALGITCNIGILSAISIIAYVATFAIGLGPIPFLITPEVVDTRAVATAGGLGLAVNWIMNFIVAAAFLEIREFVGGNVFYIFAAYLVLAYLLVKRYVPETKGKTVEEAWQAWKTSD